MIRTTNSLLRWIAVLLTLSPISSQTRQHATVVATAEEESSASMVEYWDDPKCFETSDELREAVRRYQNKDVYDSELAKTYGWPIGTWCVSNLQDFSNLFSAAKHHRYFDEPLEDWDMGSATDVSGMFQNCHWFNQPLGKWDMSSVTTMQRLFAAARNFNQASIGHWNVERVTDMSYMFLHAFSFQQPEALTKWNIRSVRNMEGMLRDARSFDASLLKWDVSHVENTQSMVSSIAGVSVNLRGQSPVLVNGQ